MHVVTRRYSGPGAKELCDLVVQRKDEVEKLMRGVNGFVRYVLIRVDDEWFSATICQDKSGCDESVRIAKDWVAKNASSTGVGAPQVTEGEVVLQFL